MHPQKEKKELIYLLTCMWAPYPGVPMKIQSVLLDSEDFGKKYGLE